MKAPWKTAELAHVKFTYNTCTIRNLRTMNIFDRSATTEHQGETVWPSWSSMKALWTFKRSKHSKAEKLLGAQQERKPGQATGKGNVLWKTASCTKTSSLGAKEKGCRDKIKRQKKARKTCLSKQRHCASDSVLSHAAHDAWVGTSFQSNKSNADPLVRCLQEPEP